MGRNGWSSLRRCSLSLGFMLVMVAMTSCLPFGEGEANEDSTQKLAAQKLLKGLQSADCKGRREAITAYLQSADNTSGRNAGLRALRSPDQELQNQASSLLIILEDDRVGASRIAALAEQISRADSLPRSAQQVQLKQHRDELLKIVRDPVERFTARTGAPWLLTRVLRAGEKDNPGWIPQWRKELDEMLKGRDAMLRVVASVNAALGRFPEGSDPHASEVAQALIEGLQNISPVVRDMSYTGLGQITPGGPCFEATDTASRRASAVQDWKAWWKANKAKLEARPIKQSFW